MEDESCSLDFPQNSHQPGSLSPVFIIRRTVLRVGIGFLIRTVFQGRDRDLRRFFFVRNAGWSSLRVSTQLRSGFSCQESSKRLSLET